MRIPASEKTITYINSSKVDGGKKVMGKTNPETWKLWKDKYVVLKNFIPQEVIKMTLDTWKTVEAHEEWDSAIMYRETRDITHMTPEHQKNKSKGGYCTPWGVALHRWLWDALKGKIDMTLRETYSYSRRYERGAYLTSHTDRPSCEISATVCLDYKTDDNTPWKIWVQNDQDYLDFQDNQEMVQITQSIPPRLRKNAIGLSLEPGDVLLYQGPNIPHWRDTFVGDYSYHIFLHFYAMESMMMTLNEFTYTRDDWIKDGRPVSVLEYDGRVDRYSPKVIGSRENDMIHNFHEFWDKDFYRKTRMKKAEFCNSYDHLTLLEGKNDGI